MKRGRTYRQTPTVRRRLNGRRIVATLLFAVLVVSVGELFAYWTHSRSNRAEQAELTAQYKAARITEQKGEPTRNLPEEMPDPTPEPARGDTAVNPAATQTPLNRVFFQTIGLTRDSFKQLLRRNRDTVGWLTIPDVLDLPVVYRDNEYYLTHDFDGKKNACGAIFLDVNHPLNANTQNLLIYGHNMKDGSMFGHLIRYTKDSYLRTHYTIKLETRLESFTYLIFAVDRVKMDIHSPNFLNFAGHPTFTSAKSFIDYIDEVYQKSLYTRFLDVDETDTLLTMVTCIGEDRLALVARRQRADETDADLQHCLLGLYER